MATIRDELLGLPQSAVEAALDEFDELGEEAFLDRYGYRPPKQWILRARGREYPPRAVLAVAYGKTHGRTLTPEEGPRAAMPDLLQAAFASHGMEVVNRQILESIDDLVPGRRYKRRSLHDALGGPRQQGISTPQGKDYILLFSGPSGKKYGYYDGWDGDTFRYSGEGPEGDMEFVRGNRAIRDHVQDGKRLLLFQKNKLGAHRYEGTFICEGYEIIRGHDVHGHDRAVIQFLLTMEGAESPQEGDPGSVQPRGGQGRIMSAAERTAIEKYAVARAIEHYETQGWDVIEKGKPYDLHCTRGDEVLYVEVKGAKSAGSSVTLTRNEVDHMRQHFPATALYVVSGVDVREEGATYIVEGGEPRELHPWQIEEVDLRVTEYSYRVEEV